MREELSRKVDYDEIELYGELHEQMKGTLSINWRRGETRWTGLDGAQPGDGRISMETLWRSVFLVKNWQDKTMQPI